MKKRKKKKKIALDLRGRSNIIVEIPSVSLINQDPPPRIKKENIDNALSSTVAKIDMDFMITDPRRKAVKQMRLALKKRLGQKSSKSFNGDGVQGVTKRALPGSPEEPSLTAVSNNKSAKATTVK